MAVRVLSTWRGWKKVFYSAWLCLIAGSYSHGNLHAWAMWVKTFERGVAFLAPYYMSQAAGTNSDLESTLCMYLPKNGNQYGVTINEMPNISTYRNLKCGCTITKCKEECRRCCNFQISTLETLCKILKELQFCSIYLWAGENRFIFIKFSVRFR